MTTAVIWVCEVTACDNVLIYINIYLKVAKMSGFSTNYTYMHDDKISRIKTEYPTACAVLISCQQFMILSINDMCYNTLRPIQNGRHLADDTFKYIFLNENVIILPKISLTFVPKGPINNIPLLVLIMAWRRPGDKPLSEPMMARLPTHICVTRPQ